MIIKGKRIWGVLLSLSLLFSMAFSVNVIAEDGGNVQAEEGGDVLGKDYGNVETENELVGNQQEADDSNQNKESDATVGTEVQTDLLLEYLYVENPYLETPSEQNIVVSWGDGSEAIEKLELLYQYNGGEKETATLENKGDGLFLYQKSFTNSESGVYIITDIRVTENGEEFTYNLSQLGIEAAFGVDEYYPGYIPEDSTEAVSAEEGVAVVTEEELKNNTAEEVVEEALGNVGVEVGNPGISVYSLDAGTERSSNNQIVIAIDAGHDSTHAGAYGNGVHEEVATLAIAKYCKEELEQYSGVKVYMCRENTSCPYPGESSTGDIRKRVRASVAQGADVYVSIHLNSGAASANGAEIWYPDSSQTPAMTGPGKSISEKILSELTKLGIGNRGVKETDDNYACMDEGAKYGLPAVIVEHAFVSNYGDASKWLQTDSGLKSLGVADATGIANYFGLSKGRWETDSAGNKYYYENNQMVKGEKKIGGKWYHFDENTGVMTTGWFALPGKTVYYAPSGEMLYGEQKIQEESGKAYWYHFDEVTGAMTTGWYTLPEKTVYYSVEGKMLYGEQQIDGKTYFFNRITGAKITGWYSEGGKTIYCLAEGGLAEGEKKIDGKWYCFEEGTGYMITGWYDLPGKTVYYAPSGEMLYGEQKIQEESGKAYWYHFDEVTGAMTTGWYMLPEKTVYYSAEGKMLYGEQTIDGVTYYFDLITGKVNSGWANKNGEKIYILAEGGLAEGEKKIDGKWYCFEEGTGYMITGWYDLPGKTVYYAPSGEMLYGEQKIQEESGKAYWYHFDEVTGAMTTGWYTLPGKTVYYASSGEMLYGQQKIDSKTYCFNSITGAKVTGWYDDGEKTLYCLAEGGLAEGEKKIDGKWYCFEEGTGYMITGWYDLPGKTVYYAPSGEMLYGEQKIQEESGKAYWYHFDEVTGAMTTGWYTLPGKTVYYSTEGKMLYGSQNINGKSYYFDLVTGKMATDTWIEGSYYGKDGVKTEVSLSSYRIEGNTNTNVEQMVEFYLRYSPIQYPAAQLSVGGAPTLYSFAQIYYEESEKLGIRAEVAWAQSMLETGYLQFGGQVSIEQFNFAGLGATDGGASGADFSSYGINGVRMGVRAQIQHLKAYASPNADSEIPSAEIVDPRFHLVSPKGCAQYVEYLGQKENPSGKGWATAEGYGYRILSLIEKLLQC